MITLEKTRELLGRLAHGKSDAELDAIRHDTYARVGQLRTAYLRRELTKSEQVVRNKRKARR